MSYSPVFLDHFLNARHAGSLSQLGVFQAAHHAKQPFSSAELYLLIKEDKVIAARFHASTTPALIASGEYVCRWLEGKTLSQCEQLTVEQVLSALQLPAVYSHVVVIVVRLIQDIIKQAA